jgi:carbamoyl-phosphate synthase large subunit
LVDKFLEDAVEVDVDAVSDGHLTIVGGVMEHIEEAGVHSGDSACVLPPFNLPDSVVDEIKQATYSLASALQVRGLMNIQFAVKQSDGEHLVYVLEVNPRASRTSPFVSKATNVPLAKIAAKIMVGVSLAEQGVTQEVVPSYFSVKESVFPFNRFVGVDIILGPEMKSTGEVMGIADEVSIAFAKSQIAAGSKLPQKGTVFVSLAGRHKQAMVPQIRQLKEMGFHILCTSGTARIFRDCGIEVDTVKKLQEGRPNLLDYMANKQIAFVFNTPSGKGARTDEGRIRAAAVMNGVSCVTTLPGCIAVVNALEAMRKHPVPEVRALQDWIAEDDPVAFRSRK